MAFRFYIVGRPASVLSLTGRKYIRSCADVYGNVERGTRRPISLSPYLSPYLSCPFSFFSPAVKSLLRPLRDSLLREDTADAQSLFFTGGAFFPEFLESRHKISFVPGRAIIFKIGSNGGSLSSGIISIRAWICSRIEGAFIRPCRSSCITPCGIFNSSK